MGPRMGDIGTTHAIIDEYFAPYDHRPTGRGARIVLEEHRPGDSWGGMEH